MSFTRAPAPNGAAAAAVEGSERRGAQVANEGAAAASANRLVFGLGSRTNRLKHDEYAERRSRAGGGSSSPSPSPVTRQQQQSAPVEAVEKRSPATAAQSPPVRASKYGNFHRPQQQVTPTSSTSSTSSASSASNRSRSKSPAGRQQQQQQPQQQQQAASPNEKMKETMQQVKSKEEEQQQKPRMQFNIPPPPKASLTSVGGGGKPSVVSYAKSRIYERPSSPSGGVGGGALFGLEAPGKVPASISSGIKPPKQVMVSKAREQWEGGEPFAKCKSRQRLAAAQAGRKAHLLQGAWSSLASVVATQQQQLARAPGGTPGEPQVRILTRGSVLERVQQFEKAPEAAGGGGGGGSPSPTTTSSGSSDGSISPANSTSSTGSTGSISSVGSVSSVGSISSIASTTSASSSRPSVMKQQLDSAPASKQEASLLNNNNNDNRRRLSLSQRRRSSTNSTSSIIPKFYHPFGRPNTYEIELQKKNIVGAFDRLPERRAQLGPKPLARRHFHAIALACGFSEYFKEPLLLYVKHQLTQSNLLHGPNNQQQPQQQQQVRRNNNTASLKRAASIDNSTMEKLQAQTCVSCDQFLICWRQLISSAFDQAARFVHLLAMGQRNHLLPDDFVPLIMSVIEDHPGLKFLRAAPDFHMRYIQTVIARIYYNVNRSWTGKISLQELRQSNLLEVLQVLAKLEDINQVTDYFSYEHFYVIYCKFWSLDQDHDLLISKEDLARHNDAAISSRIIERIFMGIVSKQIRKTGKMSYSDFVWFLMAEEDKKHPRAIEYWFRLMDIDGDGYISMYEMEYFYYEQMKRLELMSIEALPFIDSACQILDLVNPKEKNKISLSDLKRTKMAPIFFDTFINLEKYLEHESREFVSSRDVILDNRVISDWERYASEEYESLVTEETTV